MQRARAVGDDLRIEVPNFAAGGSNDEAAYTFFFEQFLGKLEETAKDFDERVVEESRELLVIATSRIFSNLVRLQPSLDLETLTARVDISDGARKAAEAYANKFNQAVVGFWVSADFICPDYHSKAFCASLSSGYIGT